MTDLQEALLAAGVNTKVSSTSRILAGANAQAWEVMVGERKLFAKQYPPTPPGGRDRLRSEEQFLTFADRVAPGRVPSLVGVSTASRVLVTEFVEGEAFAPTGADRTAVDAAAEFVKLLNRSRARPSYEELAVAADAAFSLRELIAGVDQRIAQLQSVGGSMLDSPELGEVVADVVTAWPPVRDDTIRLLRQEKVDIDQRVTQRSWIISPSDFGFHNALVRPDGSVCFLDFEYGGWDEPVKLIGDFFSQVAVPVPSSLRPRFVESIATEVPGFVEADRKAALLDRVFAVKWACIALNLVLQIGRDSPALSDVANNDLRVIDERVAVARQKIESLSE